MLLVKILYIYQVPFISHCTVIASVRTVRYMKCVVAIMHSLEKL